MKSRNPIWLIVGCIIIAAIFLFLFSDVFDYIPMAETTPEYIKDVVVLKEGADGFVVYFILADAQGVMVRSSGTVTLTISENSSEQKSVLFKTSVFVPKEHFQRVTVGRGTFKRKVILYSFGRLTYSLFWTQPDEDSTGKVEIEFNREPDSRVLKGSDTIFF